MGLVGVVAGATIAMVGPYVVGRAEARERLGTLLLEQCSQLVALSEDYRNRIWEERNALSETAVADWDLPAYRLAQARLKILCTSEPVLASVTNLQQTGIALGREWRLSRTDGPAVETAWKAHRKALDDFTAHGSSLVLARLRGDRKASLPFTR